MSTATTQSATPPIGADESASTSYGAALKSTASIGVASIVSIAFGIVRTKVVAATLGPAGVGLLGVYGSITSMAGAIAGLGIQTSGVRQIAEAAGKEDDRAISVAIATVRKATLVLGVIGSAATAALAPWLSQWTFGNKDHALALAILSITILFTCISGGQFALVQGMRRIGDLARVRMIGAMLGTVLSVPLVWWWGMQAIVPFMVAVSAMAIITGWWYARKVPIRPARLGWDELYRNSIPLLRLGAAFMLSGLMTLAVAYILRLLIVRRLGLDAAGCYQASANLGSIYVGFVLAAMGADFYPRLTALAGDQQKMVKAVNEQAEIALLLAAPGVLATLALAPLVIRTFYSAAFLDSVELLRWQALGVLLRVISWPLGYVVLAKGNGTVFVWTELAANVLHCLLIWYGMAVFGLTGTGMAFFAMYVGYWALIYVVVRRMTDFRYSPANRRLFAIVLPATVLVFLAVQLLPLIWAAGVSLGMTTVMGVYCMNALARLAPASRPARVWQGVSRFWVR